MMETSEIEYEQLDNVIPENNIDCWFYYETGKKCDINPFFCFHDIHSTFHCDYLEIADLDYCETDITATDKNFGTKNISIIMVVNKFIK